MSAQTIYTNPETLAADLKLISGLKRLWKELRITKRQGVTTQPTKTNFNQPQGAKKTL